MIQDSIIKEIQFTESVLTDLERCKDNQGVFNREAMCHISSLRDIAREYLYTLYRLKKGTYYETGDKVNIATNYNDPESVVQELCFHDNRDVFKDNAGRQL